MDSKRLGRDGYDAVAERYLEWNARIDSPAERRFVPLLLASLPEGARMLELGCGNGLPRTRAPGGALPRGGRGPLGGTEPDWLGAPMYWSGYGVQTNLRMIREASLEVEASEVIYQQEDGVPVDFHWIVARKADN